MRATSCTEPGFAEGLKGPAPAWAPMTNVEIEYCVPCGHRQRAIDTQSAILERFEDHIDGVRLKTGTHGVFKVRVDDELVYDKAEEGYDLDLISERVGKRVDTSNVAVGRTGLN